MNDPVSSEDPRVGLGLLLVLATACVSGVSTFVNLYAVSGTNSDAFVTVRNALVALAIVPLAVLAVREAPRALTRSDWLRLSAIGLIGGALPFLLFFHGLELASAAHGGATASFFYRTLFLMATVLGVVFLAEKFRWRTAVGAILLLAGNAVLLSLTSPIWTDGTGYVVLATLLWAVEYTLSKRTMRDLPSGTVALGRMGLGALFLFAYLGATSQLGAVTAFSGGQWEWIGISAALLVAFVTTWYAGLARVDLGTATAVLVLGYPITFLLAVSVQGTRMTLGDALGVSAVFSGVLCAIGYTLVRKAGRELVRPFRSGRTLPD
jgi:drug/metabolite transporter (DMT)-like permease